MLVDLKTLASRIVSFSLAYQIPKLKHGHISLLLANQIADILRANDKRYY